MQEYDINELILRYKQGTASEEEVTFLLSIVQQWTEYPDLKIEESEFLRVNSQIAENLDKEITQGKTVSIWPRIAAAVALVVLGIYFFSPPRHPDAGQDPALAMNDIAPGKNGATLTLANGKMIHLSDAKTGVVIGDDKLAYIDGGEIDNSSLSRSDISPRGGERSVMLTASTTKGQTYEFTLPDGTKVWLNASSKLHIPSSFFGTETRKLKLEGEAYFEVFKDKKRPFIVETAGNEARSGQEVTVLGTHFNISSYANEPGIKTTLLEGSVHVASLSPLGRDAQRAERSSIILKPNQQSVITTDAGIKVSSVNAEDVIAWKEGVFVFNDEFLPEVMRKIARWYNVEVHYDQVNPNKRFGGSVSRYDNISTVLKKLEQTGGIHFKIEGRRVTAMK